MVSIRTAIYGGTFNPIHNAHLHILNELQKKLCFDRVLVIPTFMPPHKVCSQMASGEARLEMCRIASKELSFPVEVSDIEIQRSGKSYTADTLCELRKIYPGDTFYFIMGEDMFLTVDKWYEPLRIFGEAILCAVPRSDDGLLKMETKAKEYEKLGAVCLIEKVDFMDISSTEIRERVSKGLSVEKLVPESIAGYIAEAGLYREE